MNETGATTDLERTRRHLEHAYERDLPVTLTRYADPQLLGRVPVRCSDVLPLIYAQQRASQLQRQLEKRDYGDVAEDADFIPDDDDIDGQVVMHEDDDTFVGKRNVFPRDIWHALSDAAASRHFAGVPVATRDISALAAGMEGPGETAQAGSSRADGGSGNAASHHDELTRLASRKAAVLSYLFPETKQRHHSHGAALGMKEPLTASPSSSLTTKPRLDGAPDNDSFVGSHPHARDADDSGMPPGEPDTFVRDEALLYGVRAIPAQSPEFLEVLAAWLQKLEALEEAGTLDGVLSAKQQHIVHSLLSAGTVQANPQTSDKPGAAPARRAAASQVPAAKGHTALVGASAKAVLSTYTYKPLVKQHAGDILDSLVPPRLLFFFDIDGPAAARFFRQLRDQLRVIRRLETELQELRQGGAAPGAAAAAAAAATDAATTSRQKMGHAGEDHPASSSTAAGYGSTSRIRLLERQLAAAYAVYRGQHDPNANASPTEEAGKAADGAGSAAAACDLDAMDPIVGEALLMMETASAEQATRHDLLTLEVELDQYLQASRARGAAHPLHSPAYESYLNGVMSSSARVADGKATMRSTMHGTATRTLGGTTAGGLIPRPPPSSRGSANKTKTTTAKGATKPTIAVTAAAETKAAADTAPSGVAAPEASPTFGLTTSRGPLANNNSNNTVSGGGHTVRGVGGVGDGTPQSTPPLPKELSRERTILQFHLLKQELLRQVVLDLPERGVLLARLLNEAELSLSAYDTLVRAASVAAQRHKILDGAENRHAELSAAMEAVTAELDVLKARKASLEERQAALKSWAKERRAADEAALAQRVAFSEVVAERLRQHTETVRAQQDRERRGSTVG